MTPVGSGPTVTATLPLKALTAEAITVIACAVPPGITLMVDGAAMREKSAWLWGSAWAFTPTTATTKKYRENEQASYKKKSRLHVSGSVQKMSWFKWALREDESLSSHFHI